MSYIWRAIVSINYMRVCVDSSGSTYPYTLVPLIYMSTTWLKMFLNTTVHMGPLSLTNVIYGVGLHSGSLPCPV